MENSSHVLVSEISRTLRVIMEKLTSVEIDGSLWEASLFGPPAITDGKNEEVIDLEVTMAGIIVSRKKTLAQPKGRLQKLLYNAEDALMPVITITFVPGKNGLPALSFGMVAGTHSSTRRDFFLWKLPCRKEINSILKMIEEVVPPELSKIRS